MEPVFNKTYVCTITEKYADLPQSQDMRNKIKHHTKTPNLRGKPLQCEGLKITGQIPRAIH